MTFALALGALALTPGVAAAADRYVDAETGANSDPGCSLLAPCATITYALTGSEPGDEIRIDSGTYAESVTLGGGRSLAFHDFVPGDGEAPAIVDGGAGTAITVDPTGAGHIRGLRIHGEAGPQLNLNGDVLVEENVFDEPEADPLPTVQVGNSTDGVTIHDNDFSDETPVGVGQFGIYVPISAVAITENTFTGMGFAAQVGNPGAFDTLVAGNEIVDTRGPASAILASSPTAESVTIRENRIVGALNAGVTGITANGNARLVRNEISGVQTGVLVGSDQTGVTLEGDRIWGNTADGLRLFDTGTSAPQTSVSATSVTIVENTAVDYRVDNSTLTLDSSIVQDWSATGTGSCAITFSRGSSTGDPSSCDDFTTTADPMLANAVAGDLHLLPGSPMIDRGNPALPPLAALDFDGDSRALIGTSECVERRDIGADEFVPGPIDCDPPETTIESGPQDGSLITDQSPTFTFSSDDPGATFECSVDDAGFGACSGANQHDLGPLADGVHTFQVRAIDDASNADPSPSARTFTVDTTPPDATITKAPPRKTTRKKVTIKFEADEEATFTCKLDAKPAKPCSSPYRPRVKPGRHVVRVTAIDTVGHPDSTPAKVRFRRVRR